MHPAGTRAFEERDRGKDQSRDRSANELPPDMLERFEADPSAWTQWQSRPAGFRRGATSWILSAKRPETRERRFLGLVDALRDGRVPAPFIVASADRERNSER
jgi:uncharacterized protein YdeI (YjbR/CyaY-like superfamily)